MCDADGDGKWGQGFCPLPSEVRGLVGVLVRRIELQKSLGDVPVKEASFSASRKGRRGREQGLARRENLSNGGWKLRAKKRREAGRGGEAARPENVSV